MIVLKFPPVLFGVANIMGLGPFVAPTQQEHNTVTDKAVIHTVAGPEIEPKLMDTFPDAAGITEVAKAEA
jgi:hypothetical protein